MKTTQYKKLVLGLLLTQPAALLMAQQQPWENAPQLQQQQQFNQQQLSALVAPIALYPDALLSQVLVAATYPGELQQAGQWLQLNGNLSGPDLVNAASQQPWDASIQALVVFPDVVSRMTSNMQWTTDLGNAFLAQQGDVMNAVQMLRGQARTSGRLASTPQQNVIYQDQGPQSTIEIQPADPQVVYVPSYNPEYIWGTPAYGYYYPPLYYPQEGFGFGFGISIGRFFSGLGWGGWGWHPNWYGHTVVQNNYFFSRYSFNGYRDGGSRYYGGSSGGTWAHNPEHRGGVAYSGGRGVSSRYGGGYGNYNGGYAGGGRHQQPQQQSSPRYNGGRGDVYRSSPGYNSSAPGRSQGSANSYGSGYGNRPTPSNRQNGGGYQSANPSYSGGRGFSGGGNYSGGRGQQSVTPSSGGSYQQTSPSYSGGRGFSSGGNYGGGRGQQSSTPSTGSYQSGGYQAAPRNYGGGQSRSPEFQSSPRSTPSPRQQNSSPGGASYQPSPRSTSNDGGGRATPSSRAQSYSSPSAGSSNGGHRGHGR